MIKARGFATGNCDGWKCTCGTDKEEPIFPEVEDTQTKPEEDKPEDAKPDKEDTQTKPEKEE